MSLTGVDQNNPPGEYTPIGISQWIQAVVFTAGDGTEAAPNGHNFEGEITTGLWRPGNGQIGVSLTGSEAMRFKSTGIDFDTGTYRADLQVTAQTVGDVVLTIPDMANVDMEVVLDKATQTLTNKTFTAPAFASPTITGTPDASAAVWSDLGQVLTADIDGGTLDSVVVGGAAAAAGTFTTLNWTSTTSTITESLISDLGTTVAMVADNLSVFAATTSAQLRGVLSDETGTGSAVFATSPTLVTPALGTPSSGVATNLTGTAAGLTAGNVTTNANLTGHVTSVGNAALLGSFTMAHLDAALSDGTVMYTGDVTQYTDALAIAAVEGESTLVLSGVLTATNANLTTPALGTPSALVGTNISGTAASLTAGNVTTNANLTGHVTSVGNAAVLGSFTLAQLNTAISDNNVDPAGTDNSTDVTLAAGLNYLTIAAQEITLGQVDLTTDVTGLLPSGNIGSITESQISDLGTTVAMVADNLSVFAATTSAQLAGVISDETGSGSLVFATSPTLVTPNLGIPSAIDLSNATNLPSTGILVDSLAGSTWTTLEHSIDVNGSGGIITGGLISDGGSGTIDMTAGTLQIRITNSDTGDLYLGDFGAATGQALTDQSINYIYIEYNAGSPQIVVYTTPQADAYTNIIAGIVWRDGTTVHITNVNTPPQQVSQKLGKRFAFVDGLTRQSGSVISETGTRNIAVTSGAWWLGLSEYTIAAVDTSAAGTFSYYYQDGVGGFTEQTLQTAVNNTQYDDGSGSLATLGNSKYGVHWVYRGVDGDSYVIFGTGSYTLTEAEDVQTPTSLPVQITGFHAALVGKIIIQKSASTFTDLQNPYGTLFAQGVPSNHSDLSTLEWTASGHTGTATRLAAFDGSGLAAEYTMSGSGTEVALTNSPTLVTPALGTPSALVGTNITGTAAGLTAGNVTTNANLTGGVTSVGNAATVVTNANLTGHITSVGNATVLGSFSQAQLMTALTDETIVVDADIGSTVQAWDANLDQIAALATTDSSLMVGNGSAWVLESGATLRTSIGVDAAGTDNSTNVTLAGTPNYLTLSTQQITLGLIDLATDVTGELPETDGGTGISAYTTGDILYATGANTLGVLAIGSNTDVLTLAGGVPTWATQGAPGAHATSHQDGGGDEISVTGLSGLLADDQHVLDTEVIAAVEADPGLNLTITAGSVTGITDIAVADGGTGSSTASGARTNLGVAIGTNVQAWDANLDQIAALAVTDGNFMVGNGSAWVAESGATARTSLGLGSLATASTINNGDWSGTDLSVANGGTGVSTLTDHGVVLGSGTAAVSVTAAGTSGQLLASGGSGADPDWVDAPSGSDVQEFTSSGTWTKPSSGSVVMVEMYGAGSGGASGRRYGTGNNRNGGAGGSSGSSSTFMYAIGDLSATESVTVGAGGTGGAGRTIDDQNGVVGTAGGDCSFSSDDLAHLYGGQVGGSYTSTHQPGFNIQNYPMGWGSRGANGRNPSVAATPTGADSSNVAGGGGAGGSIQSTDTDRGAGEGGKRRAKLTSTLAYYSDGGGGGAGGGTGGGAAGSNGAIPGAGGGGGACNSAGAGGTGGDGSNAEAGSAGGGGGGGGGCTNGSTSGAGGAGGDGYVRVTTW